MNIAIILTAGNSSRIERSNTPKQFIKINNKSLIMYTLEKFLNNKNIDRIIVVINYDWIDYLNELLVNYKNSKIIDVIAGGQTRNNSLENALKYITKNINILDDDIILTHDGARIFIDQDIINKNIDACRQYGAINTVSNVIDTICVVENHLIKNIPNRDFLYQSQTPQTFKWSIISRAYNNCVDSTDACGVVLANNFPIHLVINKTLNLKITNDDDLKFAEFILKNYQ